MNDEEYAIQKVRIQLLIDKWLQPLGLLWWRTEFVYCRDGIPENEKQEHGTNVVALARVNWQYLDAEIKFDMPLISDLKDERLESIFVHECMHVFLREMRWQDHTNADNLDHEERVATLLAKAFIWTYEAGQKDAVLQTQDDNRQGNPSHVSTVVEYSTNGLVGVNAHG